MVQNKIKHIRDLGQSIWLDFFDREILDSGKLKKMIEEDDISGVTSNPSIFEKAISGSSDYDEDIRSLIQTKTDFDAVFFTLAIKDIKRAADLFKPVYKKTKGLDGFVSIEVSPHLAHDTAGTIRQARELWKAINRKNVMIKIPATAAGLPAIRKCISEGININITLLFGLPRYEEVTEAYISGLEDRLAANNSIDDITSVASFFLSRIDVLLDPVLKSKGLDELKGQVAIASAKKAYEIYKNVFFGKRFKALGYHGAKRQRVLWASTGTKDPTFSDVKYVSALIGPETINTIPLETLAAFRDHGRPESRLEEDMGKAANVLEKLRVENIDIDAITQKLEDEGIEKFNKAYDEIVDAIKRKKIEQNSLIKQFEKLTTEERQLLYKAPVLVSVLASCSFNEINKAQKDDAIKLSHLKTFTADPLLHSYYTEVDKHFKTQFEAIAKKYFPFDENKRNALKKEIEKVNQVVEKLDKAYGQVLHESLERYAKHVKKAAHSVFQDFIFPVPIRGLTD